jgi:hypothetical protein
LDISKHQEIYQILLKEIRIFYPTFQKNYLFEYHKYVKEPYVIVVPFNEITGNEKIAIDFLDLKNSKMLYVNKDEQLNQWISGHRYIGTFPKKELLCVNYE